MSLKQRTKRSIMAFVAITMLAASGYSQSTITLNVDSAKTIIPKEIYGLLMERLGRLWSANNGSGIFVGTNSSIPNTDGMRKDVIEGFKECGVGAAEWPGGCAANGYNWNANKRPSNDVGVDRFFEFCNLTGAEAVIAGKPNATDASSNLAFVKYIVDSLKYPLKYFKVGNEVWGCGGSQSVNTYMGNYTANYNAMKDYFASKKISMVASVNYGGDVGWIKTMLNSIGSQVDGVEVHHYIYHPQDYSSTDPTTAQYWDVVNLAYKKQMYPTVQNIISALDQTDAQKRVKIVEDEWGDWFKNTGDGWEQQNTVLDALSAGETLNMFMDNASRVQVTCLAQAVSVIHSIMNISNDSKADLVKTPTFYVYKMYKPHHENNAKLVPVTASNYQTVNGNGATMQAVTACATVDSTKTVTISLTNVDMSATRQVSITLTSSIPTYSVVSADVVTGAAINSCNEYGQAEKVNSQPLPAANYSITGKVLSVTLPSKSVAVIRLAPPSSIRHGNFLRNASDAFSIKAGSRGTVLISSSANLKAPVTISLYSSDGRILIDRISRTFEGANNTCVLGKTMSKGVYLVKISSDNVNFTKQVVIAK